MNAKMHMFDDMGIAYINTAVCIVCGLLVLERVSKKGGKAGYPLMVAAGLICASVCGYYFWTWLRDGVFSGNKAMPALVNMVLVNGVVWALLCGGGFLIGHRNYKRDNT